MKQGLARAAAAGMGLLKQQFISGDWATVVNGWRYPPPEMGRFGDDFLRRAADQSLAGIATNNPAEAVCLINFQDAEGRGSLLTAATSCSSTPTNYRPWTRCGPSPPTPQQTSTSSPTRRTATRSATTIQT